MELTEISNVLWRERELLELLLFKLEEEQLLIATGRNRWLGHATREVEVVIGEIRKAETIRATHVDILTEQLGLAPDASLRELIEAVPPEWQDIFSSHREEFLKLTHQIHEVAKSNRDSLTVNQKAAEEALAALTDDIAMYDPTGKATSTGSDHNRTFLVDEAL